MSTSDEGGQIAQRGFAAQSLIVILEGLSRSDWDTVQIEPDASTANSDSMQKVDIRWMSAKGLLHYDQVKHSKNPIMPGDIENWTAEIGASLPKTTATLNLHLLGIFGSKVNVDSKHAINNVNVHTHADVKTVQDATAHHLSTVISGLSPLVYSESVVDIAGILMANSMSSKLWSRTELKDKIEQQLQSNHQAMMRRQQTTISDTDIDVRFEILTIPERSNSEFSQIILFYATRRQPSATTNQDETYSVALDFTDCPDLTITHWFDGNSSQDARHIQLTKSVTGRLDSRQLVLTIVGPFQVAKPVCAGVRIKRSGPLEIFESLSGVYQEPILRSEKTKTCRYGFTLVTPYPAKFEAPFVAFRCSRVIELLDRNDSHTHQKFSIKYNHVNQPNDELAIRLRGLLICKFRVAIGQPTMKDYPDDLAEIEQEIQACKDKLAGSEVT